MTHQQGPVYQGGSPIEFDRNSDQLQIVNYLRGVAEDPFVLRCARYSVAELRKIPLGTHVEVGCGVAHDLRLISRAVGPAGKVILFDHSYEMLLAARADNQEIFEESGRPKIWMLQGDAQYLPLKDGKAESARIVKVLQHVSNPSMIIDEIARTLTIGGILIAIEPFYSSIRINASDRGVTRLYRDDIIASVKQPNIGREVIGMCESAGLTPVTSKVISWKFQSLDHLDRTIPVRDAIKSLVERGKLSHTRADEWLKELEEKSRLGEFAACFKYGFIVAKKLDSAKQ